MIQIDLAHEDGQIVEDWFYPGELLIVQVQWELSQEGAQMKLRLLWETEGKGTENSEVAFEEQWNAGATRGQKKLEWRLPRGPLSCEGTLLKIRWYVDCYVEPLGVKARRPLQLSTTALPIRLPAGKLPPGAEKVMKYFGYKSPQTESNPAT